MALLGLDERKTNWEEEVKEISTNCRQTHSNKSNIIYIMHPSPDSQDGDPKELAKKTIERELEKSVKQDYSAVLIYPKYSGVYIDSSKVTLVRGDNDPDEWFNISDIKEGDTLTLCGGKLRKCLGVLYKKIVEESLKKGIKHLKINLFLDGVYTHELPEDNLSLGDIFDGKKPVKKSQYLAEQEFLAGLNSIGIEGSLLAMLASVNKKKEYWQLSDFDYGFVNKTDKWKTNIYLNGKKIETIGSGKKDLSIDLFTEANIKKKYSNKKLEKHIEERWQWVNSQGYDDDKIKDMSLKDIKRIFNC